MSLYDCKDCKEYNTPCKKHRDHKAVKSIEDDLRSDKAELIKALNEAMTLQSHYAELLNTYDGGKRLQFKDAEAWVRRLREVGMYAPKAKLDSETWAGLSSHEMACEETSRQPERACAIRSKKH